MLPSARFQRYSWFENAYRWILPETPQQRLETAFQRVFPAVGEEAQLHSQSRSHGLFYHYKPLPSGKLRIHGLELLTWMICRHLAKKTTFQSIQSSPITMCLLISRLRNLYLFFISFIPRLVVCEVLKPLVRIALRLWLPRRSLLHSM